jgi:hypothetical protein
MPISSLTPHLAFESNPKLAKATNNLSTLLTAIELKSIPNKQEQKINEIISGVNNFPGPDPQLIKQIKTAQAAILKILEQELKIVSKNHFQHQWLAIGMAVFGLPMGVVFGLTLGNIALLGIGLPIGMAIGIAVGTAKDKEALEAGKQLEWQAN